MKKLITILCSFVLCISLFGCQKETKDYIGKIEVKDYGTITLKLDGKSEPITVKNLVDLAKSGFYDGLKFHRIIEGFMIQGGDPLGNGTGGPGYSIKGEFKSNGFRNDLRHERGVISMARAMDPNSAGSQFFIMHADAPHLDGSYAAFGKVIDGMGVVDSIASVRTNMFNDAPVTPVVIKSITVDTKSEEFNEPNKLAER